MEIDWQLVLTDHGPAVWRKVRALLGNDADARDCYQNVFLEALKCSQKYGIEDWGAFLGRIARVRSLDVLRRRYRSNLRIDADTTTDQVISRLPTADETLQANELSERLRVAIASLSPQQAETFLMRYIEHLTYDEIAQRTGSNRNAVGVILNRAKQQLRALLGNPSEHENTPTVTPHSNQEPS